jgi:cytochrome bd-type quinol oxidase subunit 2
MHKEGRSMLRTIMRILLIILAVLFTAVQAIAITIGTSSEELPGILQRTAAWPWQVVVPASLGLVALAISDWWWERRQASTRTSATGGGNYTEGALASGRGCLSPTRRSTGMSSGCRRSLPLTVPG